MHIGPLPFSSKEQKLNAQYFWLKSLLWFTPYFISGCRIILSWKEITVSVVQIFKFQVFVKMDKNSLNLPINAVWCNWNDW